MPSIKDLKKRIGSVKNTQQTTKAMKMVSAAKLRRAQDAIIHHRPYAKKIDTLIRQIAAHPDCCVDSPLLHRESFSRVEGASDKKRKLLLVLVSSDRGLCAAFNANIIRTSMRWTAANKDQYESIELSFVGRKAYDFFKTKPYTIGKYHAELGGKVTFLNARKLADFVLDHYLSGNVDEVKFIYNEFKNVVSQKVVVEDFLPLQKQTIEGGVTEIEVTPHYLFRPTMGEILNFLLSKHFVIQTYRILLESQAGEHGARMSAMENATKNAGEMIRKLTLQFNKQRQAGITKELLEIIGGSESQKNSN